VKGEDIKNGNESVSSNGLNLLKESECRVLVQIMLYNFSL